MKILIADDDPAARLILEERLTNWGYNVIAFSEGSSAFTALRADDSPRLAILDWVMPGMDGVEICRQVRKLTTAVPHYLILLATKNSKEEIVQGLQAGADDYITKPFDRDDLHARVQVGTRTVELQRGLARRVTELEDALSHIRQLQGLLPICAYCKKVRDDHNYWQQVETYIGEHSAAQFSHSICPDCYERFMKLGLEQYQRGAHST